MLIDTHCHLDDVSFDADRAAIVAEAMRLGVSKIIVPAIAKSNFDKVIALGRQFAICEYALGIHPMYVSQSDLTDLTSLKQYLSQHQPIAIGEIGLDYFVTKDNIALQQYFLIEQLKLASEFNLPVILHVRNAIDDVLKYLRQYPVKGGIAHAFNGSLQQAQQFIQLGFKLGFGGVMTYHKALKIRALAKKLPIDSIVLETDAPDMPPEWLGRKGRNAPTELPKIAAVLSQIRGCDEAQIMPKIKQNVQDVFACVK